ncbi:MAG: hypothetical protein EOP09_00935 [Proteobacteria bacterium]|nr:MAG: hypothetical protein EOP09_00935 [Pseudomonadota bacterium]
MTILTMKPRRSHPCADPDPSDILQSCRKRSDSSLWRSIMKRPVGLGLITTLILSVAAPLGQVRAGTREIPPPPPRTRDDETRYQESYFGREDLTRNRGRFRALEDDEGREVDMSSSTVSNSKSGGRSPASIRPRPDFDVEPKRISRELDRDELGGAEKITNSTFEEESIERRAARVPSRPSKSIHEVVEARAPASLTDTFGIGVSSADWMREQSSSVQKSIPAGDSLTRRKGVQEVSLIANDLGFFPKTVFVSRDIPVRLFVTGASKQPLCIMMDTFNVKKQVRAQKVEEITFTPSQPGTYRFYCPVNGSEGVLVVRELGAAGEHS